MVLKKCNGNSTFVPLYFLYLYYHVVVMIKSIVREGTDGSDWICTAINLQNFECQIPWTSATVMQLLSHIPNTHDVLWWM